VADRSGAMTTLCASGPLVSTLDDLQHHLDEGPSLTAMRAGHTVIVDDAESEHRWPRFMRRAVDVGLRSYLGVPIAVAGTTSGVLNLYSTVHTHLDAERLAHATLSAAQAGLALEEAQRENDLVLALQSSRTIGKAIGLVMERFDLDDHEAFAHLTRLSQRSQISVGEVAAHLVSQANGLRQLAKAAAAATPFSPALTLVPSPVVADDSACPSRPRQD
jgi:GAF domain-containing protein